MGQEQKNKWIRLAASMIMAVGMVLVSEVSGEPEVLFPEIVALLTGAWAAKQQPWVVSKKLLVLLMSVSAVMGICFVRYLSCPLLVKIVLAYIITGVLLIYHRCSLAPMISACILPILMGTKSIVYPISVAVMAVVIAVIEEWMETAGLKEKRSMDRTTNDRKQELKRWCLQTVAVGILAIIPLYSGAVYCIAPPLLVLFTEFCNVESSVRKTPVRIAVITCLCACSGALARYFLCVRGGLPLTCAAILAIVLVFAIFLMAGKMFPPAGALAFLPFLIPEGKLAWYPAEVAIGVVFFMLAAIYVVAREEETSNEQSYDVGERVKI